MRKFEKPVLYKKYLLRFIYFLVEKWIFGLELFFKYSAAVVAKNFEKKFQHTYIELGENHSELLET